MSQAGGSIITLPAEYRNAESRQASTSWPSSGYQNSRNAAAGSSNLAGWSSLSIASPTIADVRGGTPSGSSFRGNMASPLGGSFQQNSANSSRWATSEAVPLAPERILTTESASYAGLSGGSSSSASRAANFRDAHRGQEQRAPSSLPMAASFPSKQPTRSSFQSPANGFQSMQSPMSESFRHDARGTAVSSISSSFQSPSNGPPSVQSPTSGSFRHDARDAAVSSITSSTRGDAPFKGSQVEQLNPRRAPADPRVELHLSSAAQSRSAASSSQGGRSALKQKQASAEPQLLIMRASYLSGLKAPSWFERPPNYLLSIHVGDEARADPPSKPGKHTTNAVPAAVLRMVAPEEMELRHRIENAIGSMLSAGGGGGELAGSHECRFNSWVIVRLNDAGPGPAAGGPAYFRVDVWAEQTSLFGKVEQMLFGRVFVPLHNPEWQRRPCTWPVVNADGRDIAYLTCEFAFAHAPDAVRNLQVDGCTSSEVSLSWRAPRVKDEVVPILGYQVEALALHRGQEAAPTSIAPESETGSRGGKASSLAKESWQMVAEVEVSPDPCATAGHLKGDTRYRFRVSAVNEAGVGDVTEVEAVTGPSAPGMCGRPRLGGCNQSVLTIEWSPPTDDGGSPIVGYCLWVRPFSPMCATDSGLSLEHGHIKHIEGQTMQRADIYTDELNPSVSRYLCSVAALNSAGEFGPPTSDANSLPFPNPCAVCGPVPQAAFTPGLEPSMSLSHASQFGYQMHANEIHTMREPSERVGWEQSNADHFNAQQLHLPEGDDYLSQDRPPPPPPRPVSGSPQDDYDVVVPRGAPAHMAMLAEAQREEKRRVDEFGR